MTKPLTIKSTGRDDYATPWTVIEWLEKRFGRFDLDPCCARSTAKAPRYFISRGLAHDWHGNIFMNPPWSQPRQSRFIERADQQTRCNGADQVVGLIPSCNMDTIAWHNHILAYGAHELIIVRGRINFELDGVPMPNSSVPTAFPVWRKGKPPKTPRLFSVNARVFK